MRSRQTVRQTLVVSLDPATSFPLRLLSRGVAADGPWAKVEVVAEVGASEWEEEARRRGLSCQAGARDVSVLGPLRGLGELGAALPHRLGGPELEAAAAALAGPPGSLMVGDRRWRFGPRTLILGIVNTTPDSFSGDGVSGSVQLALERAAAMVAEGADAIDVGGESSRPGHAQVPAEEEIERVVPAIQRIAAELKVPVFVDTWKAAVAEQALRAGAVGVNDIWGLRRDPQMAEVAARHKAALILMHNQDSPTYRDLVGEVMQVLAQSLRLATAAGVQSSQVILDPGFGFGKTPDQSVRLLSHLEQLSLLGRPVLVGTSRKSMVGYLLRNREVSGRLHGTTATLAWAATRGAHLVRVHDVLAARDTLAVVDRLRALAAGPANG